MKTRGATTGLLIASGYCVAVTLARLALAPNAQFAYMLWNLVLAWVPYVLGKWLPKVGFVARFWLIFTPWLLFLPNAFYVVTDLAHLQGAWGISKWYDVALLVAYIWVCVTLGLISLREFQVLLAGSIGKLRSAAAAHGILVLVSVGVYFGRFLRLNSWDLLTNPQGIGSAFGRLASREALGFVVLYYLLYAAIYEAYTAQYEFKSPKRLVSSQS
ncbi:MAG: DUF1361 domain-containing protein [Armatimonadetes bacterium]|nr:DUF1361 domain-containing protein [Armatimonadota bacterium]